MAKLVAIGYVTPILWVEGVSAQHVLVLDVRYSYNSSTCGYIQSRSLSQIVINVYVSLSKCV